MADVNVQREGVGTPERRRWLHGNSRLRVGLSLRQKQAKPRFACFCWCLLATSCRRVAVGLGVEGRRRQTCCRSGRFRSRLPLPATQLTSEGVPMPSSELRKQAQPGGSLFHGKSRHPVGLSLRQKQAKPRFACSCWCLLATSCRRVAVGCSFHGKSRHRVGLSLGRTPQSRGLWCSAGAYWRHPAAGWQ